VVDRGDGERSGEARVHSESFLCFRAVRAGGDRQSFAAITTLGDANEMIWVGSVGRRDRERCLPFALPEEQERVVVRVVCGLGGRCVTIRGCRTAVSAVVDSEARVPEHRDAELGREGYAGAAGLRGGGQRCHMVVHSNNAIGLVAHRHDDGKELTATAPEAAPDLAEVRRERLCGASVGANDMRELVTRVLVVDIEA